MWAGVVGRVEGRGIGDALERLLSFELLLKVFDASMNTTKCVRQRKDKSRFQCSHSELRHVVVDMALIQFSIASSATLVAGRGTVRMSI